MKFVVLIFLILLFVTISPAQKQKSSRKSSSQTNIGRISKEHPSVYITFVKTGKRESTYVGEIDDRIWLRLHNNTRWKLLLMAQGADGLTFAKGDEEEVGMFYGVEGIPKEEEHSGPVDLYPSKPPEPATVQAPVKDKYDECEIPPGHWCHVCSIIELKSKKSFLFSVPRDWLCKNLQLYVVYQYEWEEDVGEPEHRVYFEGSKIPTLPNAK